MVSKTLPPADLKKELRVEIQARRKLFSNPHSTPQSISQVENQFWFRNADIIAIYISQEEEFPSRGLFELCLKHKKTVVAPVMQGTELRFLEMDRWEGLLANEKNIFEPGFGIEIKPENIDLFFVPLVGYDRSGNRLGRGGKNGGFYDRLFSNKNIRGNRVGVGFEIQECFLIPTEDHDVKMDYILTERRLIKSL